MKVLQGCVEPMCGQRHMASGQRYSIFYLVLLNHYSFVHLTLSVTLIPFQIPSYALNIFSLFFCLLYSLLTMFIKPFSLSFSVAPLVTFQNTACYNNFCTFRKKLSCLISSHLSPNHFQQTPFSALFDSTDPISNSHPFNVLLLFKYQMKPAWGGLLS
jgi:predicted membrane chloride channel (bestrophin family)